MYPWGNCMKKTLSFILVFLFSFFLYCGQECLNECDEDWETCNSNCAVLGIEDFESWILCSSLCEEDFQSCESDCAW